MQALCASLILLIAASLRGEAYSTTSPPTSTATNPTPSMTTNEMLVPSNSTTALICEPIFNENSADKSAAWFKDGREVAEVTGHSNAILGNRPFELDETMPQVGFLIIPTIQTDDEGEYWCARKDNAQRGEKSRLRVAYLRPFPQGTSPKLVTPNGNWETRPMRGQTVRIECPNTEAVPPPAIFWLFNGEPVDFSASRLEVAINGSLVIQNFDASDSGVYECVLANFAGRAASKLFVGAPREVNTKETPNSHWILPPSCVAYFRNGILWFLIGCLTTSCIVLIYLLAGMLCYRYASARSEGRSPNICRSSLLCSLLRADPSLAPGFRKVIAPMPDYARRGRTNTRNAAREDAADPLTDEKNQRRSSSILDV